MNRTLLLIALSALSLVGGAALAQNQSPSQPYSESKPGATKPAMDTQNGAGFSLTQLDKNKDGSVDKQEAKASASLTAIFDKADTNKDGKLDATELSAAASMSKTK